MRSLLGSLFNAAPTRGPLPNSVPRNRYPTVSGGFGGARSVLLGAMGANGTLYNVVSALSGGTSRVEWNLWRKSSTGKSEDRVQVTSHLALDVWNNPNPYYTPRLFVESTQQHMELVGEHWWVVDRNLFGWPESMWLVRPDRIQPVASDERGLAGYIYYAPNGEQIPLDVEQVIRDRQPNPADVGPAGRGLGATQTILAQIEAVHFSAQWNRNFFANSAVPGGIIQVPSTLSDKAFDRLREQWRETHQGVSNASRVGILEGEAKWIDAAPSQKDMQFVELLNTSREVIREAFGFPQFMAGIVTDVNRANAEASMALFGGWLLAPRLDRLKDTLNTQFLPMFYPEGRPPDVEFDYESPVPEDEESENASLATRVDSYVKLLGAGVDPVHAANLCELPALDVAAPAPATKNEGSGSANGSEAAVQPVG